MKPCLLAYFASLNFFVFHGEPQFLRLSSDTPPDAAYNLITKHWRLPAPNLVVSVVGGEAGTKMKTWVREVLRQGLVKASQGTGKHMVKANQNNSLSALVTNTIIIKKNATP